MFLLAVLWAGSGVAIDLTFQLLTFKNIEWVGTFCALLNGPFTILPVISYFLIRRGK